LSRDHRPLKADCVRFPAGEARASSSRGPVGCLDGSRLAQRSWGCPTPCLRVSRHHEGAGREAWSALLRPRNLAVPSDRPTHKRGGTSLCARAVQVRVRDSTPSPCGPAAVETGASARVPSHAQGQGTGPRCASACVDARRPASQRPGARLRPARPREAAGALAPRPALWQTGARSNAPSRGNRSETARAR
jgi:hypothetical protein